MSEPTPIHDKTVKRTAYGDIVELDPLEITPNVVVSNPNTRRNFGVVLYIMSFVAAIVALFLGFFPEFNAADNVLIRLVAFFNATISLASGAFGVIVTLPNVPKRS